MVPNSLKRKFVYIEKPFESLQTMDHGLQARPRISHQSVEHSIDETPIPLNRPWQPHEDEMLQKYVAKYGVGYWTAVAAHIPNRSNHQCRQRWSMYLDPAIDRTPLSPGEYRILMTQHTKLGNKWLEITKSLPGRYVVNVLRVCSASRVGSCLWMSLLGASDFFVPLTPFLHHSSYAFICDIWYTSIRRWIISYLSDSRGVDKLQIASDELGRFKYLSNLEFQQAVNHVISIQCTRPRIRLQRWTIDEDMSLEKAVTEFGMNWVRVAQCLPGRTNRQCRERYVNYLDPCINKAPLTTDELRIIITQQSLLGNKWTQIVKMLPLR
jgi:hypothetical protein